MGSTQSVLHLVSFSHFPSSGDRMVRLLLCLGPICLLRSIANQRQFVPPRSARYAAHCTQSSGDSACSATALIKCRALFASDGLLSSPREHSRISQKPVRMVPALRTKSSLARDTGSIRHFGERGDAAANNGGCRHSLFSTMDEEISDLSGFGAR